MPTYTYQCLKCASMVDEFRKIADRDVPPNFCLVCGTVSFHRIQAAPAFTWHCDGSHKDDYNKHGPRKRSR